jgi:hypothetical protein
MPVFKDSQASIICNNIHTMFRRHAEHHIEELEVSDALDVFLRPEHREVAVVAGDIYRNKYWGNSSFIFPWNVQQSDRSAQLTLMLVIANGSNGMAFLPPGYAGETFYRDNEAAFNRVARKFDALCNLYNQYNLMSVTFDALNGLCASPAQMKFLWPAISVIIEQASKFEKVEGLKKALDRKPNTNLPLLPPKLRTAMQDTSTTATVLQMIGDAPAATTPRVAVQMHSNVNQPNAWRFK